MYITTGGLVLRETIYKESSKILTVLTADSGKLTVNARGARRRGSTSAAGTQLFTFSEMTLYEGKGGWTLTETRSIEQFEGLRTDIEKLSLASYFAELLETVSDEDEPSPLLLQLGLNALYALSENLKEDTLIKTAFELRLMAIAGFSPQTDFCPACGKTEIKDPYLSMDGFVSCRECLSGSSPSRRLDKASLDALRYIISADAKRIFSFRLPNDSLELLSDAAETYVRYQLDKRFYTLDYYKKIKI